MQCDTLNSSSAKGEINMAITDEKKKAEASAVNNPNPGDIAVGRALDFGDLKPVWGKLIDKKRPDAESGLLRITTRISKLDPIAELALAKMKQTFSTNEAALRKLITRKIGRASCRERV